MFYLIGISHDQKWHLIKQNEKYQSIIDEMSTGKHKVSDLPNDWKELKTMTDLTIIRHPK